MISLNKYRSKKGLGSKSQQEMTLKKSPPSNKSKHDLDKFTTKSHIYDQIEEAVKEQKMTRYGPFQ